MQYLAYRQEEYFNLKVTKFQLTYKMHIETARKRDAIKFHKVTIIPVPVCGKKNLPINRVRSGERNPLNSYF